MFQWNIYVQLIKGGRDSKKIESAYRLSASPARVVRFGYPLWWRKYLSPLTVYPLRFDFYNAFRRY